MLHNSQAAPARYDHEKLYRLPLLYYLVASTPFSPLSSACHEDRDYLSQLILCFAIVSPVPIHYTQHCRNLGRQHFQPPPAHSSSSDVGCRMPDYCGWRFFAKMILFPATGSHQREFGLWALSAGAKPLNLFSHIEGTDKGTELNMWSLGFLW